MPDISVCFISVHVYLGNTGILRFVVYSRFWLCRVGEMFFTNVFFMFFIIGYKTCFLMFFILTSMFFTTMDKTVGLKFLKRALAYYSGWPHATHCHSLVIDLAVSSAQAAVEWLSDEGSVVWSWPDYLAHCSVLSASVTADVLFIVGL